jgi:hypothetical protein
MRARVRCQAPVVAATALVAVLIGIASCGGDDSGDAGPLTWQARPRLFAPEGLPSDRVLNGRVRNESLRRVDLRAEELKLLDEGGRRVAGSAIFRYGFVHGLYPPTREPSKVPDAELLRTGRIARILPGRSVPLTISWRTRAGDGRPVRIDYGRGALDIPAD